MNNLIQLALLQQSRAQDFVYLYIADNNNIIVATISLRSWSILGCPTTELL